MTAAAAPTGPRHHVVLGVGGGIAAYKACELLRRLTESGHDVTVVPTAAALEFVGAPTWAALSGKPVASDVWSGVHEVPHVRIGQTADLVIVAPCTADLMAKAAHGLADDLLTNTLLTARCPVVLAPAMHTEMWEHAATQANVATLRERGVLVVEPAEGRLTGADTGKGRLPDPVELFEIAVEVLARPVSAGARDLAGRHVVVSAGGTREPLDPVRFLGNRSSGLQGYALARAAVARGAEVTLVAANVTLADPAGVKVVRVVDDGRAARRRRRGRGHRRLRGHGRGARRLQAHLGRRVEDQEVRRRLGPGHRAGAEPRHPGRGRRATVPATGRWSSGSPPRPATSTAPCSTTPAPSSPARAATCSWSTTSAGERCSAAPTTRPSSSAPTATAVDVPRGSKTEVAHAIWDQVARRFAP